jgi:hypothetical protein
MDDAERLVPVILSGGPFQGYPLKVPISALEEERPGFSFVAPNGALSPDDRDRVLYTAEPEGPPTVWFTGFAPAGDPRVVVGTPFAQAEEAPGRGFKT